MLASGNASIGFLPHSAPYMMDLPLITRDSHASNAQWGIYHGLMLLNH